MNYGLTWQEAHQISREEMVCILEHVEYERQEQQIVDNDRAITFMPMADPDKVKQKKRELQAEINRLDKQFFERI